VDRIRVNFVDRLKIREWLKLHELGISGSKYMSLTKCMRTPKGRNEWHPAFKERILKNGCLGIQRTLGSKNHCLTLPRKDIKRDWASIVRMLRHPAFKERMLKNGCSQ
jgi:hypothetical protein